MFARREAGRRRTILLAMLTDALYTAMVDLQDNRATPIGIRQGRRVLNRHSALLEIYPQLAAGLGTVRTGRPPRHWSAQRWPSREPWLLAYSSAHGAPGSCVCEPFAC